MVISKYGYLSYKCSFEDDSLLKYQFVPLTVILKKSEVNDSSLLAYYPLNGNANDESSYGNNGISKNVDYVSDRNSHVLKSYLNGMLKNTKPDDYSTFTNNNDSIKIGTWDEENSSYLPFFKGYLDEIKIFNRALSDEEINNLYNE